MSFKKCILKSLVGFFALTYVNGASQQGLESVPPEQLWKTVSKGGVQVIQGYLDSANFNPNLQDHKNRTLLEMAIELAADERDQGHEKQVEDIVLSLVRKGASCDHIDAKFHSPVYIATSKGNINILNILFQELDKSPSKNKEEVVNKGDELKITCLHIASKKGYSKIIECLLKNGASVDKADIFERSPLHIACYYGNEISARLLVEKGASLTKESKEGMNARQFALSGSLKDADIQRQEHYLSLLKFLDSKATYQGKTNDRIKEPSLKSFYETFNAKLEAIFLTYRILHTGIVEKTKSIYCASNAVNLLGIMIPLPGGQALGMLGAAVIDNEQKSREQKKIKAVVSLFPTIKEMENAVEDAAYYLTGYYEDAIKQLTDKGAECLAVCAVGRFVEYIRNKEAGELRKADFSETLLQTLKTYKVSRILPWQEVKIETQDSSLSWTDRYIFQEYVPAPPFIYQAPDDHVIDESIGSDIDASDRQIRANKTNQRHAKDVGCHCLIQ